MKSPLSARSILPYFLAFLLVCSPVVVLAAPTGSQWEYRVVSAKLNQRLLEQMLNNEASQGWELVQITERGFAIFKRKAR